MTEQLTPANNNSAMDLVTGAAHATEHIAAPAYFTYGWSRSKNDDVLAAAQAAKVDLRQGVHFAINKAGITQFLKPFEFFLLKATPVYTASDKNGKVIRSSLTPFDKCDEGYVGILAVKENDKLTPTVITLGRAKKALGKGFQKAAQTAQMYAKDDLGDRGEQFTVAAKIAAKPWRCKFTLSGKIEESENGEYVKPVLTSSPANADDVMVFELNEVTNVQSEFFKDLVACNNVYEAQIRKARGNEGE